MMILGAFAPVLATPVEGWGQEIGPITLSDGSARTETATSGEAETITASGTTPAVNVTNGALVLDASGGGTFAITNQNAHSVLANASTNPATISILGGTTIRGTGLGTGLVALGSAAAIDATDVNIAGGSASGSFGGNGAVAESGGQIALRGNTVIATSRQNAIALGASGAGSMVSVLGSPTISTSGNFSAGVYMHDGGRVVLPEGATLNLNGMASAGIVLDNTVTPVTLPAGITVNLNGAPTSNGGTGLAVLNGSTVSVDRLTVQGIGAAGGVTALSGRAQSGTPQPDISADARVSATVTNARIDIAAMPGGRSSVVYVLATPYLVSGNASGSGILNPVQSLPPSGLLAAAAPTANGANSTSTINAIDSIINVHADQGVGASAGSSGNIGLSTINLTRGAVSTDSANSIGLLANANGLITANGTQVTTTNGLAAMEIVSADRAGAPAIASLTGSALQLTDSVVTAAGQTRFGLASLNSSETLTSRFSMSGGSLASPAYALYAQGPTELAFDSGAKVTAPVLLHAAENVNFQGMPFPQSTLVNLNASGKSELNGDAQARPNSIANINLMTGSKWTGAAFDISNVSVDPASTWNVTGDSILAQQLANAGTVAFTPPAGAVFKTLTTQNYVGNGGILGLNTLLEGDGSPSDKLIINGGGATGTSGIRITNAGGQGRLTSANGILVVDTINGGTTNADAFALAGRATAGVYEYRLFRGSVDSANPQAWYLRSEKIPEPPPPTPPTPPTPPVPPEPLLRPEIGAYLANQRIAAGFLVHSLHDRLGEPQWTEQQTFDNDDSRRGSAWVRLVGKDIGSRSRDGNFDVNSNVWLLHAGGDVARWSVFRGDDRLHLGGMLGYSWGSSEGRADGNPFRADSDVQGVNIGLYGTWFQNDETRLGWYTDLWAQYGWYSNHVNGELLPSVKYDSRVLALSAEAGYAWYPRRERDWVVEPQGQLIYVRGTQSGFSEPNGTRIDGAKGDGVITRLGVRLHRTWIQQSGRRIQPYLTLNWWHDTVDNAMAFNQVSMRDLYPENRYEVKIGVDAQGRKGWTGWSNVGWQFGSQSYHAFTGRIGAKYTW
ncbi:putative Outer membrane autotransporter barrel [Cupriavidus taiwanensis]|uniref:autotransporter outer membrane beta-barrel domain-containing protein n=1 Tax=Cupriavidus taiwanensis TaxID=164546 RepID=UPI000E11CC09|nr:autotransporter outer membrane beta-barrel domain-containing protein [Cupriavidus taiwanensis]SOZ19667.1 putative Outer membrane autotransporter barrel [Cupriavidus taiwanensis]SOZ32854.1 putative Outer membrane autotransporter barrel [Cupriavidus taiwanensis]SOZ48276.1 putative Outer membrane autotransporter barrel [Cupriavidus taiwanensis]